MNGLLFSAAHDYRMQTAVRKVRECPFCHHVTDANGVDVFVDWNAKNPDHPNCEDLIREKWDGFTTDRAPGDSITAGTLHKFLTDAGAGDLIPRISAEDDFNEPVVGL